MTLDEALSLCDELFYANAKTAMNVKSSLEKCSKIRLQDEIPVVPYIDAAILAAIETGGDLDMSDWHTCETAHCRAGWAIALAGDGGRQLEHDFGPETAGALIYFASRPDRQVPSFFASDDEAMADIRRCAKADPLPVGECPEETNA